MNYLNDSTTQPLIKSKTSDQFKAINNPKRFIKIDKKLSSNPA